MLGSAGHRAGLSLALALLARSAAADVLELEIAVGGDDAEETGAGSVYLASGDLALGEDGAPQTVGLRFTGLAILPEHLVTAAWLQFRADETEGAAAALSIHGEAAPDAAPFGRASDEISGRPRTAAAVTWSPPPWSVGQAGAGQRTPDLSPVLQEIVDGPGWTSGSAIVLVVTGSGRRAADSFEGGFATRLHVEFEPARDEPPVLSLTSPGAGGVFAAGDPVELAAVATDAEDGDLSAAVAFASDLDGPLGTGSPLVRSDLSPGVHQIAATVTDSAGNPASAGTTLLVTGGARVLAAGDIASCTESADEATATLLDGLDGLVLALGDNAYPSGRTEDYADCYDPTWGRHRPRTRPIAGNHEYDSPGAAPYFAYFGPAAGDPDRGWYSFDYGGWHFVALNSNCAEVGGCGRSSPQGQWLAADLAAHPSRCTLAYWHHPRFSSSNHGSSLLPRELWRMLQERGADLVLVGHDHAYERFAPQDGDGVADPLGMRQFVVGTGGRALYPFESIQPNSEARDDETFGVLALDLAPDGYAWQFHPIAGQGFTDEGTASCVSHAPELSLASPLDGAVFAGGNPIRFEGAASDVEEGDLSASLRWSSSRDGEIGAGAAFVSTGLSCGPHLVTAAVTDLHGGSDEETIQIQVGPEGCAQYPQGCGVGPELLALVPLLRLARRRVLGPAGRPA